MRDPFDTGPTLRLGDAKAVAPDPEIDRPQVDTSNLTMVEVDPLGDMSLRKFEDCLPQATQYGIIPDAYPYSFDDVSLSIGGMELTPVSDEGIKIEAEPWAEEDRRAHRSPRFNVSMPAVVTVDDFAKAIKSVIDRNGVVGVTPEQIAALAGNLFYSTFPKTRPPIDLFTAAFAPRVDHGDTSPEALRANHDALVAKKDPQK